MNRPLSRVPWAFLGAVGLLAALEVGLRVAGWPHVVPYELGSDEYHAISTTLDTQDVPEVVFVGSSRTRESIYLPDLQAALREKLGRDVSVASYAVSSGRTVNFEAIVRRILREPVKPRLILCGINERELAPALDQDLDRAPIFWNFADWQHERAANPRADTMRWLPFLVRNQVGQAWRTLGLRDSLRLALRHAVAGVPKDGTSSPVRGEASVWQATERKKSLKARPMSAKQIQDYIARLDLEHFPDAESVRHFDGMLDACRDAGVPLVVFDPPLPMQYRQALRRGLLDRFFTLVETHCRDHATPFFNTATLPLKLGDMHYREQSHMNVRGAKAFATEMAEQVIAPRLAQ